MDRDSSNESIGEELPDVDGASMHSGFVSGWTDDDEEGVEEEESPHDSGDKEILWAAENGNVEVVRKLLAIDGNLTKATDKDGYTPLHRAAYNNHLEIVNLLLEHGADYNAETNDGWTPLHSACNWNAAACAEKFMSLGINVNVQSKGGITPLHLAASNKQSIETLQALLLHPHIDPSINNNSKESAHEIAVRKGQLGRLFEVTEPCFNYI